MRAQATPINVGGVIWDPDSTTSLPSLNDFFASGKLIETPVALSGDILTAQGSVQNLNSSLTNQSRFCPGCELTFSFSAELVGFNPLPPASVIPDVIDATFLFKDFTISFYVDTAQNLTGADYGSATDGDLWLQLESHLLSGQDFNLGSGSDTGTGASLLNAVDGLAMANFDTNLKAGGADMFLSSSFGSGAAPDGLLAGTFELFGDPVKVSELSSLALLGLGMLALGFGARRKSAT